MQIYTHKTRQIFEPSPNSVSIDANGTPYTTPLSWAVTLGGLAFLQVLESSFVYNVRLDAASTIGSAVVQIKHGDTVLGAKTLDLSNGEVEYMGSIDLDLTGVNGAAKIVCSLVVETASSAGRTAQLFGALDLSGPLIVSGC